VSGRSLTHDLIPDIDMSNSPIYQFYANKAGESEGTIFAYPEVLSGLSDATAVGDPLIQRNISDGDGDTWDASKYDGTDDSHDWVSDSQLPVNDETFSIAALVWIQSGTGKYAVFNWGDASENGDGAHLRLVDGAANIACYNVGDAATGSNLEGAWVTIGGKYDGTNIYPVANGSVGSGTSVTYALSDAARGNGLLGEKQFDVA
jgi:hypothetical protein